MPTEFHSVVARSHDVRAEAIDATPQLHRDAPSLAAKTQPETRVTMSKTAAVNSARVRKGGERRRGRLDAPRPCQRTLIVGDGETAQRLAAELKRHFPHDFLLVGFVKDESQGEAKTGADNEAAAKKAMGNGAATPPAAPQSATQTAPDFPILGTREELSALVRRHKIDRVMFSNCVDWQLENTGFQQRAAIDRRGGAGIPDGPTRAPSGTSSVAAAGENGGENEAVPRVQRERRREVGDLYEWASSPAFIAPDSRHARSYESGKRAFDIAFSLGALALSSPLAAVVLPLVKFSSPGPIFYSQERVGRGGAPFTIYKIRSMKLDAETSSGPMLSPQKDDRSTPVGKVLRATKIDEMPQFWNVLRGDMSIVGPRPERPHFVDPFNTHIYSYALRHSVRPGLTGLAQIKGDALTHVYIKLHYDLIYVCHRSLALDLSLLLRTPGTILMGALGRK